MKNSYTDFPSPPREGGRMQKRQIQAVYHQYKSIPRIAVIKTVHNFIASFLLEHHKGKSYFLHSGCPIKKRSKRANENLAGGSFTLTWGWGTRRRPPHLSSLTPFFHPFFGPAVISDESIQIIINWMTLLLFIWPFSPPLCWLHICLL